MKLVKLCFVFLFVGFAFNIPELSAQNQEVLMGGWKIMKGTDPVNKQFYFKPFTAHEFEKKWTDFPQNTGSINDWLKSANTNPQLKPWTVAWSAWFLKAPVFSNSLPYKSFKHNSLRLKNLQCADFEVYINEQKLDLKNPTFGQHFIDQSIDITPFLKGDGTDTVVVGFISPKQNGLFRFRTSGDRFTADNEDVADSLEKAFYGGFTAASKYDHRVKISPYFREPAMDFGWDFARAEVKLGLGGGVYLTGWNQYRFEDARVQVNELKSNSKGEFVKAICTAKARVGLDADFAINCTLKFGLKTDSLKFKIIREQFQNGLYECQFSVENPKLWYPIGCAEFAKVGFLYQGQFSLYNGAKKINGTPIEFGIRDLKVDTVNGAFRFVVNGKRIMAMGANLIWNKDLASKLIQGTESNPIPSAELKKWAAMGLNCLRVWGGGSYPSESFYKVCDQLGIMVWQDLMFANTLYPSDNEWKKEVGYEVESAVQRMTGHACLALVCGNNEIEVAWKNWGWQQTYHIHGTDSVNAWHQYLSVFDTLIPRKLQNITPTIFYLSSSPIGNWGHTKQMLRGDNHDWGVWHGDRGFNHSDTVVAPFVSEFGFPSATGSLTKRPLLSYKGQDALNKHITDEWGNVKAFFNIQNDMSFVPYELRTQYLQSYYLQKTVRAYRTSSANFGGFLFWQLNDVDSVTSWSLYSEPGFKPKFAINHLPDLFKQTVCYLRVNSAIQVSVQRNSSKIEPLKIDVFVVQKSGSKSSLMNKIVDVNQLYSVNLPLGLIEKNPGVTLEVQVSNAKTSKLLDRYIHKL